MTTELEVDTIELPLSVVEQIADLIKENDFLDNGDDSDDDDSSLDEFINGGSAQTACLSSSVNYIIPEGEQQDISVGIVPKGNGALLSDYRGNCRGINAVDLQMSREQNDQVASGDYSAIIGGMNNKAIGKGSVTIGSSNGENGGIYSIIAGGHNHYIHYYCEASGIYAGSNNKISNSRGTKRDNVICGGDSNIIDDGYNHSIVGGSVNKIIGDETYGSSIIGGQFNTIESPNSITSVIVGGIESTIDSSRSVTLGGQGLVCNQSKMVTMGSWNRTENTNRPNPQLDITPPELIRQLNANGNLGPLGESNRGTVLFSIGNGGADVDRKDIFLVNDKGTVWCSNRYTCSFGADYAEIFPVSSESPLPTAGDLVSIDDSGSVHVYSEQYSNVVGIVTTNPSVVAEGRSILKHQRDPDTLELILDESGEPKIRDEYTDSTVSEVTVGLVGRILLKNKWISHVPSRWTVLKNAPESKVYDGYTYVLVR